MDTLTRDALLLLLETAQEERRRMNSLSLALKQLSLAVSALREHSTPDEQQKIDETIKGSAVQLLGLGGESDDLLAALARMAEKLKKGH